MGKSHEPTDYLRGVIETLALIGHTDEQICDLLKENDFLPGGIHRHTLRKYYHDILNKNRILKTGKVINSLYENAVNGNVTAQIFWCKTRAGWREVQREEKVQEKDKPISRIQLEVLKPKESKYNKVNSSAEASSEEK
jgi:hypothetical protein